MNDPNELRYEIAAAHGLDEAAAGLLTGQTLEELETSADALAKALRASGTQPEQEQAEPLADVFRNAARRKQEQQRALIAALHGMPPQRRDEHGRFTGFDGGARESVPHRRSPEQEHDELVVALSLRERGCEVGVATRARLDDPVGAPVGARRSRSRTSRTDDLASLSQIRAAALV